MSDALIDIETAIIIAASAHRGQTDKGGKPYILHCLRVMAMGESFDEMVVGVLHDILEDTRTTAQTLLLSGVSEPQLEAIVALTRRESEPYEDFISRVAQNDLAKRVKIYDLFDNLSPARALPNGEKLRERYCRALNKLQRGGLVPS